MSFGSGIGLAPNRRQAITWTNAGHVHRCIYAALGGDELRVHWLPWVLYSSLFSVLWAVHTCHTLRVSPLETIATNVTWPGSLLWNWDLWYWKVIDAYDSGSHGWQNSTYRVWIPNKISLKCVTEGPIVNNPALVRGMAWRQWSRRHLTLPGPLMTKVFLPILLHKAGMS